MDMDQPAESFTVGGVLLLTVAWAEAIVGALSAVFGLASLSQEPLGFGVTFAAMGAAFVVAGWSLSNRHRRAWLLQIFVGLGALLIWNLA
jgi:hypothetical protein